jgi:hypothetical protein
MAGLAHLRDRLVQTWNLKDDDSGQVRLFAGTVGGQAAIALPVISADGAVRVLIG